MASRAVSGKDFSEQFWRALKRILADRLFFFREVKENAVHALVYNMGSSGNDNLKELKSQDNLVVPVQQVDKKNIEKTKFVERSSVKAQAENTISNGFSNKMRETVLPTVESYKKEVVANPHNTPPSVIEASVKLGELYDKISSLSEARSFMKYANTCLEEERPRPVQTLCLEYAKKTSVQYPKLKAQYEDAYNSAPEPVRATYELMEKMSSGGNE